MKKKVNEQKKNLKCKHCGGMMSYSPGGHTCIMCGRADYHECDRCKNKD